MPNQYTKLTQENVVRKMNRVRNPVTSIAQLAREFGYNTSKNGTQSTSAPGSFRRRVRGLIGEDLYNTIRDGRYVNKS